MGNFENLDAVIDYAIEKEQEAAEFYLEASEKEIFSGAKEMLKDFAGEEQKHERMLKEFKEKGIVSGLHDYKLKWIPDMKRSDYVSEMKYAPGMDYKDLLMLAMKREEAALKLYNDLLKQAEGPEVQRMFKVLCQEEAGHKLKLETMYDDHMAEMGD